nr:probable BOI-related E3 ubiquitin-protein ligase 3 [Ipomoea batatas]
MGSGIPYGSVAMPESFLPVNRSLFCENVHGKTSINTDSGLSYNLAMEGSRKRSREEQFIASGEDVTPLLQQYQSEIDRIVSNHTKKLRMELEERQKQEARILVAAIGEDVMKKVREKDEQIQTLGKLNFALQERVKSLYLENQLWRDLAQSNEATANSLRSNLEQMLRPVREQAPHDIGRRVTSTPIGGLGPDHNLYSHPFWATTRVLGSRLEASRAGRPDIVPPGAGRSWAPASRESFGHWPAHASGALRLGTVAISRATVRADGASARAEPAQLPAAGSCRELAGERFQRSFCLPVLGESFCRFVNGGVNYATVPYCLVVYSKQ